MADQTQKLNDTGVEPFGALQVNTGFFTLFYDSWSVSPINTTDKWTVTGTAPTISNGIMQMVNTASTYNAIQTKDVLRPNVGFTLVRNGIQLETTTATGAGRFWGLGTPATTPAAAVLAQQAIGFEIDQAVGSLLAVTYAAGVRTTVATLTRPVDGNNHAYGVYFRATIAYWIIDGITVATQTFPNVQLAELPALIVRQNASAFTGTPAFNAIAHLTADTSRQGTVIGDPVIGTRMANVKGASTAALAVDNALVVSLSPNSPITLGTPTAFTLSSAATTNATSVKAAAGTVFQIVASNVGAAAAFLKIFNLATAPTVGTSVPLLTIPIPASGVVSVPFGALGLRFGTGIALDITNLVADSDATVIAAAQVKVAVSYL